MTDSVSDKESSFEFLNDSDASDEELEQVPALSSKNSKEASDVMQDHVMKPDAPAQTIVRKCTPHISTAPARETAPAAATEKTSNLEAKVAILLFLFLIWLFFSTMFCVLIKAQKNSQQRKISARDKIIEELKNDKRELQKVIDRAMKKDNFNKIKCLEDIPEELMSKWTPDESKFEEIKEHILYKTDYQHFGDSRPVFSKLSGDKRIIKLITYKTPRTFMVDNRDHLLLEGSCTYTMYTHKGDFGQVFVKEGLLYIILGAPEEETIKLVYIMPEEYL